jgi:hypothetical protein
MSKCKVCGAKAGFMGVICSACSIERARELHHYKTQTTTRQIPEDEKDRRSENKSPIAPSAVGSGNLQKPVDCTTENQDPDQEVGNWNENASSKFARKGCGMFLTLGLLTAFAIWALAYAACGILAVFIANEGCPQDLFALFL